MIKKGNEDLNAFFSFSAKATPFKFKNNSILYNSTKKRQHYFDILKAFFVRRSSEYKTSDSDRKVNRNIYPDAVTRGIYSQLFLHKHVVTLGAFKYVSNAANFELTEINNLLKCLGGVDKSKVRTLRGPRKRAKVYKGGEGYKNR